MDLSLVQQTQEHFTPTTESVSTTGGTQGSNHLKSTTKEQPLQTHNEHAGFIGEGATSMASMGRTVNSTIPDPVRNTLTMAPEMIGAANWEGNIQIITLCYVKKPFKNKNVSPRIASSPT
ncbi:hypothetical protein E2C01_025646 [Portunus trituberculatus]|uniref:Uncharacterized protein n=1 Tax=Portunus trituberculatus TaxID=210409 RepID=A0A5B7EG20_PORTR|nr:hypothetical protein [Portunus trituberculatus]